MPAITTPTRREIIEDFAREIRERRVETAKPSTKTINFRSDWADNIERKVWRVPIEILRYRKMNGRIASDVLDYVRNLGILDESDAEAQEQIRQFLERKDPEKTAQLRKSIMHSGQREPAIITCDGFLINGNRRKMVMEALRRENPHNEDFASMKVVILPGEGDPGGAPTLLEIEKLENRYQLQSDGKSEYYGFDRALSIRRKMGLDFSLRDQLRDDPEFSNATEAQIKSAIKDYQRDFLEPLDCVDRYLAQFGREGQYSAISSGMSDPKGRWQAIKDYSLTYSRHICNENRRAKLGIMDDEIGDIEEAAFDIIRLRNLPDLPKPHMVMRNLQKYCETKDGKRELLRIAHTVEPILPSEECVDKDGNPLDSAAIDAKWASRNRQVIIQQISKAKYEYETVRLKETPIDLLEAALKKLTHDRMTLTDIKIGDHKKAMKLAAKIKKKADELETEIYHLEKSVDQLDTKKR